MLFLPKAFIETAKNKRRTFSDSPSSKARAQVWKAVFGLLFCMCMCCTGIGSGARVQELEKVPSGVFFGRPEYTTSPDVGTEKKEFQKGFLTTAVHYYRCSYHITSDFRERQGGCWAMILGDVTICLYQRKCLAMVLYSEKTY